MIGDPSGKSQERMLLSREQIDENVAGIRQQLERFLDFDAGHESPRASSTTPTGWPRSICSTFFATPASTSP